MAFLYWRGTCTVDFVSISFQYARSIQSRRRRVQANSYCARVPLGGFWPSLQAARLGCTAHYAIRRTQDQLGCNETLITETVTIRIIWWNVFVLRGKSQSDQLIDKCTENAIYSNNYLFCLCDLNHQFDWLFNNENSIHFVFYLCPSQQS